jgi:hypothetical protein
MKSEPNRDRRGSPSPWGVSNPKRTTIRQRESRFDRKQQPERSGRDGAAVFKPDRDRSSLFRYVYIESPHLAAGRSERPGFDETIIDEDVGFLARPGRREFDDEI